MRRSGVTTIVFVVAVLLLLLLVASSQTVEAKSNNKVSKQKIVSVGVDGKKRSASSVNWTRRRYKPLKVESGTRVVFNWVGEYHGVQLARTEKDWRKCQSGGAETLKDTSLGGTFTLDTSLVEAGTTLYVFCPVDCDSDEHRMMKVAIKVVPRYKCRVAKDEEMCGKRPNCMWAGGLCRQLVLF